MRPAGPSHPYQYHTPRHLHTPPHSISVQTHGRPSHREADARSSSWRRRPTLLPSLSPSARRRLTLLAPLLLSTATPLLSFPCCAQRGRTPLRPSR